MSRSSPETDGREPDEAKELFVRFVARHEAGDEVDFEDWVREHTALASELRRLHDDWVSLQVHLDALGKPTAFFLSSPLAELPDSSFQPGEVIDDFRLVRRIGRGGMGEVWEAIQLSLGRKVALKLLRSDTERSDRRLERFQREAEAGGRLNHPGIVAVYTVSDDRERPFIAQELVEGGCTLADFLEDARASRKLPTDYYERVSVLVVSVLEALQFAHDRGVVHRDLKPQNILITARDEPKIADFGLAQIVDSDPLTHTGEFAGTYCYMSPEQAMTRHIGPIDHRTDVFSMGATLYELLTLTRAFDGDTTHQVTEKILFQDPPDPRRVRSRVPEELAVICTKALEKRREHRFQSMAEFAAELQRFLNNEPILTKPSGRIRRAQKWIRRHPTVSAVLGTMTVATLVIAGLSIQYVRTLWAKERAEFQRLVAESHYYIETGELSRAETILTTAMEMRPDSYVPPLLLAVGHAKYGRFAQVKRCVDLAVERGFDPTGATAETAEEHWCAALYLIGQRDESRYPEAERHLLRVMELDRNRDGAYFSLYQVHLATDDVEGAHEALSEYRDRLAVGNDFYPMVEVRLLELEGDYEGALAILKTVLARFERDPAKLTKLRFHQTYGRVLLGVGELDGAQHHLLAALEDSPDDCWALDTLSVVCTERYKQTNRREDLDEARRNAELALECSPHVDHAELVLAFAAVQECASMPREPSSLDSLIWREAATRVAALGEGRETDSNYRKLKGQLVYFEARIAFGAYRYADAIRDFQQTIELDPDHLEARVLLAEAHCLDAKSILDQASRREAYLAAREQLEWTQRAWAELEQRPEPNRWSRQVLQAALVWSFRVEAHLGEAERAADARLTVEGELVDHSDFDRPELLNFVEYLVDGPLEELHDCVALDFVNDYGLRASARGDAEAEAIIGKVDRACR